MTPEHGAIITEGARARYNALVRLYGSRFLVPLKEDDGVTARAEERGTYAIDAEHLEKWLAMNRWHQSQP